MTARDGNGAPIVGRSREPVLATDSWEEPQGSRTVRIRMSVYGGLHDIKGNSAPYFTITANTWENGREASGGCLHELIEERFPGRFTDLIALHLSTIDGVPMHAEANGWYQLVAAMGGLGEQYHAGNSKRNFPCTPPEGKPWQNTEHRLPTPAECLGFFAEHCRITIGEAEQIRAECLAAYRAAGAYVDPTSYAATPEMVKAETAMPRAAARRLWAAKCNAMHPRWNEQAIAAIDKFDLVIFGDGGLRETARKKGAA